MKYKLRSSTQNATDSKSTYHSSTLHCNTGIGSGPPEKRPRVEHGVRGQSGGSGHHLRRKPWAPSLISIETQTDSQLNTHNLAQYQSFHSEKNIHSLKICDLCGSSNKKRRLLKSENIEVPGKTDYKERINNIKQENTILDKLCQEKLSPISSSSSPPAEQDENEPTIRSLPLEVLLHVTQFLDASSMLCLYRSCKWLFCILVRSNAFWKMICVKEELANYSCISEEPSTSYFNIDECGVLDSLTETKSTSPIIEDTSININKESEAVMEGKTDSNYTEDPEAEHEPTARGMSGSSVSSYPTGRTSKTRNVTPHTNKAITSELSDGMIKIGFADKPMHGLFADYLSEDERVHWHNVYLRGLQMRRNIVQANFQGWRIYANSQVPVTKLTPDLDFNTDVRQRMMNYPKLSVNDDLKIDWDDHHLVVFHFFRGDGESCTIRVWDISNEPKFLFAVEKGIECITDKVFVVNGHVVIVPSWPIAADAIVMTLAIDEPNRAIDGSITGGKMPEVGKFRFCSDDAMTTIDENWEHTQLRVVRDMAMVVIRSPNWQCLVVKLPSCELKHNLQFDSIPRDFDCQQIRSYKTTAMILFNHKLEESNNQLVTIDVGNPESNTCTSDQSNTRLRSIYKCNDTVDVALFTDPEEIYLMKRNGDVVIFDPNTNTETIKIANPSAEGRASSHSEYQLFVNRKEQICVMQSAAEVPHGRNIKVYSYNQELQYTINLDIARYGMSRDESICIYTNGAFLAAADSKKFAIFNVKNGKYLGEIRIPAHLERSKGKEEKYCMFEQTGLSLFIFDEDKLITVHDYERSFPAVLDIYKFW